jgi:hypothetical protein
MERSTHKSVQKGFKIEDEMTKFQYLVEADDKNNFKGSSSNIRSPVI